MAKDRYAVTCLGRPAFYACMWEDIRKCAMDNGWAVALHGSLSSDMDIMAMMLVCLTSLYNKLSIYSKTTICRANIVLAITQNLIRE